MEADDLALVDGARAGDRDAFRTLVIRHQRKVYAVALGIVRDPDQAWDVAQEAFVRVHAHLGDFKGDSTFSTWVLRIATHLSIDALRRERHDQRASVDDLHEADLAGTGAGEGILATALGSDPGESALRKELAGKMAEALDQLPAIHREILVLRELEGLTYEELAERLGIQKGTVMSRLFHARKKMQALLGVYAERGAERGAPPGGGGGSRG